MSRREHRERRKRRRFLWAERLGPLAAALSQSLRTALLAALPV